MSYQVIKYRSGHFYAHESNIPLLGKGSRVIRDNLLTLSIAQRIADTLNKQRSSEKRARQVCLYDR